MNVTCIFVAAQHPMAIDMQIRNLQWAVNCPKKIVVFTFAAYKIKSNYPNVEIVEVDNDPTKYYHFYKTVIPDYIKSDKKTDVFVFNELDIYFDRQAGDFIDKAYCSNRIFVGFQHWFRLFRNEEVVCPRIWEGAFICPAKYIFHAFEYDTRLSNRYVNRTFISKLKSLECTFLLDDRHIGYGQNISNNRFVRGDTMSELQMYFYIMGLANKVETPDYMCHFCSPETFHRAMPKIYENLDEQYEKAIMVMKYRGSATIFHKFICGHLKKETVLKSLDYIERDWEKEINKLIVHAEQWMNPGEFKRLQLVYRNIHNRRNLLFL